MRGSARVGDSPKIKDKYTVTETLHERSIGETIRRLRV